MTGFLACLLALAVCWRTAARSLGHGIGAVLSVGFFYGIFRANVPDGASHFVFDAATLGVYLGAFITPRWRGTGDDRVRPWVLALCAWPALISLVPLQHPLVQFVGLRAAIFFLPFVLLGARAKDKDLDIIARWIAGLAILALVFGALEYVLGVPRFYPRNAATELIYRSADVGASGGLRIPATFPNAHAYGGTMVACMPLLVGGIQRLKGSRDRALLVGAVIAAAIGVFLCAARQPVVYLFGLGAFVAAGARLSRSLRALLILIALAVGAVVMQSERLQRFSSLADTEKVERRLHGSANLNFVELVLDHPMGEGLGSAVGTSIPHFLLHLARPQIGMENEWGRIGLEQGLVGLGLWLAFVLSTALRWPRAPEPWRSGRRIMWMFVIMSWGTAFIGTGMLTSIPGTTMSLFFMGALWRTAPVVRRPGPTGTRHRRAEAPAR